MFSIFNILYTITYPINYFFMFLGRLVSYIPGGKNLGNLSRAAKTAWMVFLVAAIFVSIMILYALWDPDKESLATEGGTIWTMNFFITILIVCVIPFVVYWMVRLIDTDKIHILPVIDEPWRQGVEELETLGIDPKLTPFFLVLGTDEFSKSNDFHGKSYFKLELNGTPQGESFALHWYAGAEAIFLHLNGACRASNAVKRYRGMGGSTSSGGGVRAVQDYAHTIDSGDSVYGETFGGDSDSGTFDKTEAFDPESSDSYSGEDYGRTLTGDEELPEDDSPIPDTVDSQKAARELSVNEGALSERVAYLSSLIKKFRGDEVPIDGVLAYAPCEVIESNSNHLANCFNDDFSQLRDELGSNFPVTVIVSDMHDADGFASLVNELGSKRANMARFGKGYVVENLPTTDDMKLLSIAACESFQQHIYKAYSKKNLQTSKHENKKLFSLLSRVNTKLRGSLAVFLHRLSLVPEGVDPRDFHAITGCYFAATGRKDSELAFVNGVIKKAIENCECTKWTNSALRTDKVYKGMAGLFSLLALVCFGLTIYFLITGLRSG